MILDKADSRLHILWKGTSKLQISEYDEIEISMGFQIRQPSNHDINACLLENLTRGGEFFNGNSRPFELDPPLRGYVEEIRGNKHHTEFYLIEKGSTGEPKQRGRMWEYLGMTKKAFWLSYEIGICIKPGCDRNPSSGRVLCKYHLGAYHRWLKKMGVEY